MEKKCVVFLCIMLASLSSSLMGGIVIDAIEETPTTFDIDFGWNPVEADSWSYTGTYWYGSVEVTDGGTQWDVTWHFQHLYAPHPEKGELTPGPLFSQSGFFDKGLLNSVLSEAGQWTHSNGTHYEEWTFDIGLDTLPSNNDMLLTVIHIPEPATVSLLAIGTWALIRKRK